MFGDPAYGVAKRCDIRSSDWTFCAWEGGVCAFAGPQEVRYGANGWYTYETLSDGTACTNAVFGDPAYGFAKRCDTRASDWTVCAPEGGVCGFTGSQEVRYGANGLYTYRTLSNGTACTNSVFGDPVVGVKKECATKAATDWTFCASEGQVCAFAGTREVRFGANGVYAYLTLSGGSPCTTSLFGDPVFGVVKRCDIRAGSGAPLPSRAVFVPSSNHSTAVVEYVLEIFPVGADPTVANPVASQNMGKPPVVNGECNVDVAQTIQNLPPGAYIATVSAFGSGILAQSAPSPPFSR